MLSTWQEVEKGKKILVCHHIYIPRIYRRIMQVTLKETVTNFEHHDCVFIVLGEMDVDKLSVRVQRILFEEQFQL